MNKCFMMPAHMCSAFDAEGFHIFKKSPYNWLFLLEPKGLPLKNDVTLDVTLQDVKECYEYKKHFSLGIGRTITDTNDAPYHRPLKANWRELLDELYNDLCEFGKEYFWGFSIDEPFYFMYEEDFIEVTKYLSKFNKHIYVTHGTVHIHNALWPVNESHDFKAAAFRNMAKITPENHAYVTDVGYDYYGKWEHGVHHNTVFRLFLEKLGERFKDITFWFTPPIGTVCAEEWCPLPTEEVEQICIDVFMGMWNWARQYDNFGGFFMYTYYPWKSQRTGLIHGGGRLYVLPDEKGNIKWPRMALLMNTVCEEFDKGKTPSEIELPDVGYDRGYIV